MAHRRERRCHIHCTGCGKKLKVLTDKLCELDRAECTRCELRFEILADPQDSTATINVAPFSEEDDDAEETEDSEDDPDD